jgi:hypothetical protein
MLWRPWSPLSGVARLLQTGRMRVGSLWPTRGDSGPSGFGCQGRLTDIHLSAGIGRQQTVRSQAATTEKQTLSMYEVSINLAYLAVVGDKRLWEPRSVPHRCLVSSNMERYFVGLAVEADRAIMMTLKGRTLADSLAELRVMEAEKSMH